MELEDNSAFFFFSKSLYFRFELDMLLESVSSAAKRVEELLNSINENNVNLETPFHIEDHFTGLYLLAKYWPIKFEDLFYFLLFEIHTCVCF